MEIQTKYNPADTEGKWYKYWMDNGFFKSTPDEREPYTIVIPPPNVTGVLHMGHMLNNTIQDILIRRARMMGKNALWVPGTDHASIATEAKVVNKLKSEGVNKADLSREEFMSHAWEWTHKHGGIILEQLKKLGASCDWSRTKFTMDDNMSESVINTFVDLYNKGLIYRGIRMVNWDPSAKTAVSDEEVIHTEEQSKLYYLKYKIEGTENEFVTIATTRPETILGDTAVCVNPNDERFSHLKGKNVIVPIINRVIPIIQDEYVDMEFGTGCLKITPAHDINDYEIGIRHNLESIDIFNDDGQLNEKATILIGVDRFEARKQIIPMLEEQGNLDKIEDYVNKVGRSERTNSVIEPKLSLQWFLKMSELAKPALDAVMNDEVVLHPAKFKNTYRHWMENCRDWNVSRQLWWGQQIPAYYLQDGTYVVANSAEEALALAIEKTGNNNLTTADLRQDEDVLDTWFSSWLWPISVFDGIRNPNNEEINYYYPTNDLVTGPDILFFWVARMIIAGKEYRNEKPFNNVYLTGIVRDAQRRKMSKSLGNSPDPLDLIAKYGADGVRVAMLLCSPAGGDLLFDEALTEQGRNFANKIWNSFRLINNWEVDNNIPQPESSAIAIKWFNNKLNQEIETIEEHFKAYRLSEALMAMYKLYNDEFSSWFLEMVKPEYLKPIDAKSLNEIKELLDKLLKMLHPFMPFITEEIWQLLEERKDGETIMLSQLPKVIEFDKEFIDKFENVKDVIASIRNIRNQKNIPNKEKLSLSVLSNNYDNSFDSIITKLANIDEISVVNSKVENASNFMVKTTEYFVPLGDLINIEEEIAKLEEELKYNQGFLNSVMKKLSNTKFVESAPEMVVKKEFDKKADAESKIKSIEETLAQLKK